MLATNSLALKEWAVVVQSLAAGKQILLLRKGGLYERQGKFSTEPTEFFFFPTYIHQMEQGVTTNAEGELQTVLAARPLKTNCSFTTTRLWLKCGGFRSRANRCARGAALLDA
jgi:hypothetical protein